VSLSWIVHASRAVVPSRISWTCRGISASVIMSGRSPSMLMITTRFGFATGAGGGVGGRIGLAATTGGAVTTTSGSGGAEPPQLTTTRGEERAAEHPTESSVMNGSRSGPSCQHVRTRTAC
jgi:hypothetical protein